LDHTDKNDGEIWTGSGAMTPAWLYIGAFSHMGDRSSHVALHAISQIFLTVLNYADQLCGLCVLWVCLQQASGKDWQIKRCFGHLQMEGNQPQFRLDFLISILKLSVAQF